MTSQRAVNSNSLLLRYYMCGGTRVTRLPVLGGMDNRSGNFYLKRGYRWFQWKFTPVDRIDLRQSVVSWLKQEGGVTRALCPGFASTNGYMLQRCLGGDVS